MTRFLSFRFMSLKKIPCLWFLYFPWKLHDMITCNYLHAEQICYIANEKERTDLANNKCMFYKVLNGCRQALLFWPDYITACHVNVNSSVYFNGLLIWGQDFPNFLHIFIIIQSHWLGIWNTCSLLI